MKQENKNDKKMKNLVSAVILLGGLFVGSLFVDISQLVRGGGISQKLLRNKDVFQLDEKTWVAYKEPIIEVDIINDDDCEECSVDETLVAMRKVVPTMLANKVEYNSEKGKKLIKEFGIKSLPAFIFASEVEETEFYAQAQPVFISKNDKYLLDTIKLGLPAGRFIESPVVNNDATKFGPDDAKVKLIEFSDFQCPYCQMFHTSISEVVKEYGDKIQFVFKHLPLSSIHPKAMDASLAAECANEQGKFLEYAEKLFANQKIWGVAKNNNNFTVYARQVGLDTAQFNQCLKDEKYKGKIEASIKEAGEFGISGTPAIFVNNTFKGGVVQKEALKKMIDKALGENADGEQNESDKSETENKE